MLQKIPVCRNMEEQTMTQYDRMLKGLIYDPGDPEIMKEQVPYQDKLWEFNQLKPSDVEKKK